MAKTSLHLDKSQREHLADMFKDSANIVLAALVVGQFLEAIVRWSLVFSGLLFYGLMVVLTTRLAKGGG